MWFYRIEHERSCHATNNFLVPDTWYVYVWHVLYCCVAYNNSYLRQISMIYRRSSIVPYLPLWEVVRDLHITCLNPGNTC